MQLQTSKNGGYMATPVNREFPRPTTYTLTTTTHFRVIVVITKIRTVTPIIICLTYTCIMKQIQPYQALQLMRKLSDDNIPFSFSFLSCNLSTKKSKGIVEVRKAKLRVGLTTDKGIKSRS